MTHPGEKLKAAAVLMLTILSIVVAVADEVTIPAGQLSGQSGNISAECPQL